MVLLQPADEDRLNVEKVRDSIDRTWLIVGVYAGEEDVGPAYYLPSSKGQAMRPHRLHPPGCIADARGPLIKWDALARKAPLPISSDRTNSPFLAL